MNKDFYCDGIDDCQPTAINIYFQKKIFNNWTEYDVIQWSLNLDITGTSYMELDRNLCCFVKPDKKHLYKRFLVYSAARPLDVWPPKLKTKEKKMIVDYGDVEKAVGHMECVRLEGEEIISLRTGKRAMARMVACDSSMEDFITLAKVKENNYYFRAYIFKRQY